MLFLKEPHEIMYQTTKLNIALPQNIFFSNWATWNYVSDSNPSSLMKIPKLTKLMYDSVSL